AVVDSGGVYGTMPASALGEVTPTDQGYLPDGTEISVYSDNGQTLLYQYTVGETPYSDNPADGAVRSPVVISGNSMNTGNWLFAQNPVYISYAGNGTTIIGGTPIEP